MPWHEVGSMDVLTRPLDGWWHRAEEEFAPVIEPCRERIYHVDEPSPGPKRPNGERRLYYRADHQRHCPQVPELDEWLKQTGNVGYVDGPFVSCR